MVDGIKKAKELQKIQKSISPYNNNDFHNIDQLL